MEKISASFLCTATAKAGIGIFIQPAGEHKKGGVCISAAGAQVNSPLKAEALALKVAAQIATTLTNNHSPS